ncbi:uncharacterized protein LTR77_007978 [Saxophila tyrrhenica]|uniref:Uncharacterized protein n=1 Tax=Saxophila tyrrhenica TaxID=1690608 RepID=A0AAV9P3F0_9PEZI|nr:hypothetical protein LTR77_007978 [Saxophila tyrrhenica]
MCWISTNGWLAVRRTDGGVLDEEAGRAEEAPRGFLRLMPKSRTKAPLPRKVRFLGVPVDDDRTGKAGGEEAVGGISRGGESAQGGDSIWEYVPAEEKGRTMMPLKSAMKKTKVRSLFLSESAPSFFGSHRWWW